MWGVLWQFGFLFFFQAEDGIRDYKVTGVQTCALPIWIDRVNRTMPTTKLFKKFIVICLSNYSLTFSYATARIMAAPQALSTLFQQFSLWSFCYHGRVWGNS